MMLAGIPIRNRDVSDLACLVDEPTRGVLEGLV